MTEMNNNRPSKLRRASAITAAALAAGLGIGSEHSPSVPTDVTTVGTPAPDQQAPSQGPGLGTENYSTDDPNTSTIPEETLSTENSGRDYDDITPLPGPIHGTIPDPQNEK